jgi:hypothetical protein
LEAFRVGASSIELEIFVFRFSREGIGTRMPALSSWVCSETVRVFSLRDVGNDPDSSSILPRRARFPVSAKPIELGRSAQLGNAMRARIEQFADEDEKELTR